jgi:hypothetical protein
MPRIHLRTLAVIIITITDLRTVPPTTVIIMEALTAVEGIMAAASMVVAADTAAGIIKLPFSKSERRRSPAGTTENSPAF